MTRKNYKFLLPLPQPNFVKQLSKLGFSHQTVTYFVWWINPKTPKSDLSCLRKRQRVFSPEIWFSVDLGFHQITLSQYIEMTPNASKMIEYHPFWVRAGFC